MARAVKQEREAITRSARKTEKRFSGWALLNLIKDTGDGEEERKGKWVFIVI